MQNLKFEINLGEPDPQDYQVLVDGMLFYHAKKGHPRKVETYNIFIKDKYKKVLGGIIITVLWNGMEINSWQAHGFYEKMGYKKYGKLDNFPEGNSLTYFDKKL
ncbi:MAG: hypothetical protein Q7R95_00130 [bacterium]|nr:hypothetical protein [bacterium]